MTLRLDATRHDNRRLKVRKRFVVGHGDGGVYDSIEGSVRLEHAVEHAVVLLLRACLHRFVIVVERHLAHLVLFV